jgi:hypothetical protein
MILRQHYPARSKYGMKDAGEGRLIKMIGRHKALSSLYIHPSTTTDIPNNFFQSSPQNTSLKSINNKLKIVVNHWVIPPVTLRSALLAHAHRTLNDASRHCRPRESPPNRTPAIRFLVKRALIPLQRWRESVQINGHSTRTGHDACSRRLYRSNL